MISREFSWCLSGEILEACLSVTTRSVVKLGDLLYIADMISELNMPEKDVSRIVVFDKTALSRK